MLGVTRRDGKAIETKRNGEVEAEASAQLERVVGIVFRGVELILSDLDNCARRQREDQTVALRDRHDVVGPATSRCEITTSQRTERRPAEGRGNLRIQTRATARRFEFFPR